MFCPLWELSRDIYLPIYLPTVRCGSFPRYIPTYLPTYLPQRHRCVNVEQIVVRDRPEAIAARSPPERDLEVPGGSNRRQPSAVQAVGSGAHLDGLEGVMQGSGCKFEPTVMQGSGCKFEPAASRRSGPQ